MIPGLLLGLATLVLLGMPPGRRPLPVGPSFARNPIVWSRAAPILVALLALAVVGPVGALVAAGLAVAGLRAWRARQVARDRVAERSGAVEAVSIMAAELRAGRPPSDALAVAAAIAVGPFAASLAAAARSLGIGGDPVAALRAGAGDSAVPEALRGTAACLFVCTSSGSSLALAVETVADSLRADHAQRLAVEAELAGPRATAVMLAGLPIAGTLLAAGLGARPLHVLLHTPLGAGCLLAGVGLDLLGLWWTGRLVSAALP